MRKFIVPLIYTHLLCMLAVVGDSQNISINTTGSVPDNSAILDVSSTSMGLLIPRIALANSTDNTTIASPATSLLVYCTGTGGLSPAGYYYNSGTPAAPQWQKFSTQTLSSSSCRPTEITNPLNGATPCSPSSCAGTTRNLATCIQNCSDLNYNGSTDWRLPNLNEFINLKPVATSPTEAGNVWVTDAVAMEVGGAPTSYYVVVPMGSLLLGYTIPGNLNYCRCVR